MKGYLSQGSLQNPHRHGTEILTDQVGVPVGERWPRLRPALRVSSAHGCSKKPTQPLLLPKRNKIKVLFNKTGSPKQSQRGAAHGHERAPPRALLGPSSLGASRQGRGPGQRCCMALRPPAAGTQMAGDSRRRGQQESSGAARHRLGRQRATRTDKAAGAMRRCGRARPFTGSSWLQACSLPVP